MGHVETNGDVGVDGVRVGTRGLVCQLDVTGAYREMRDEGRTIPGRCTACIDCGREKTGDCCNPSSNGG